ncbi:alcohol dehydrogenase [Xylariaceae sp. FL0255]|nr:alcohol dehydrogenase [Xylariaceae sp. FL0255]
MPTSEEYYPAFSSTSRLNVSTGLPYDDACSHHATSTFHAQKIYIIVSKSISQTSTFGRLEKSLGDKVVGVREGIRQHVPWTEVLEVAVGLHDTQADLIVTLGGGSITDAAKVASFACANSAFTIDALDSLRIDAVPKRDTAAVKPCSIPIINIPTTLSGGEYTFSGGATDMRTHKKSSFQHPSIGASLVILDPSITLPVPIQTWLASGMRAVDHCIEGLCSIFFNDDSKGEEAKAEVEKTLGNALDMLLPGLLSTKKDETDIEARRQSMLGVLGAMRGIHTGVPMGASHGIGHQLGPLGVGHGETSCVMLPSVLRYNAHHGDAWVLERQTVVRDVFARCQSVSEALFAHGKVTLTSNLGDVVLEYVRILGMPRSLAEVEVGSDAFEKLAQNSMTDRCIPTNPVPIKQATQVREILQMAS